MNNFKKYVSLIIVFAILITSVLNIYCFNVSAAAVTTMYIEGTNVGVRTGPGLGKEYSLIERVSNRSATVLNSNPTYNKDDKYYWYNVTYFNGTTQITGWVAYDEEYIRIVTYNPDADFEEKISAFPESYRDALRSLHAAYPNWEFIPDPVNMSFKEAVFLQTQNMRKQVSFSSQAVSWRSMGLGSYDWNKGEWVVTNGGWTGASREAIAYYMDPRNFLNSSEIYMFLQQGYDPNVQTEEGIAKIVSGTFMENGYVDPNDTAYEGSYIKVIMEAARQSGVSPYIIASKIRQEIGVSGTSSLVSGKYPQYEGYYNFFNYGASGSTETDVIVNGLSYAKNNGWNSRSAAIIGGAKNYSNGYISVGQDTYYYQDFNVHNPDSIWHQYAQAVHDAYNKGVSLAKTYQSNADFPLTFRIPIYTSMPESVSEKPVANNKLNNYYFKDISVSGLTPSFNMHTFSYDLYLSGDTTVYIETVEDASYAGENSYSIKAGESAVTLKVKSESGYINEYVININAAKDCILKVESGQPPVVSVRRGDTNGDGQITLSDLANIRLHLLGLYTLSGDNAIGADTNKDGQITLSDLANVRLHLLGLYTITE